MILRNIKYVLVLLLASILLYGNVSYAAKNPAELDDYAWSEQFSYHANLDTKTIYLSRYLGTKKTTEDEPFIFRKDLVMDDGEKYQVILTDSLGASDEITHIKIEEGMKWSQLAKMLDTWECRIEVADLTGIELDFENRNSNDPIAFDQLNVRKVIVADTDASHLGKEAANPGIFFRDCNMLEEIEMRNVNLCNLSSLDNFIVRCPSLKKVTFDGVDFSGLKHIHSEGNGVYTGPMSGIISGAPNLEEVVVENCNFSNCESMKAMFMCGANKITFHNITCDGLKDISYMFFKSQARNLIADGLDTSHVENMEGMFRELVSTKKIVISGMKTDSVTNLKSMFEDCEELEEIQFENTDFKKSNITDMSYMFHNAKNLTNVDLSLFNTDYVTNMEEMFDGCESLKALDLRQIDASKLENSKSEIVKNCPSLQVLLAPKTMGPNCKTKLSPELHIYYPDGTLSYETYADLSQVPAGAVLIKDYDCLTLLKEKYGIDYGMAGMREPAVESEPPASSVSVVAVEKKIPTVKGVKVKREKKTKVKISWKKTSGVRGYKIQISTSKKFTKSKTILVTSANTTKKVVTVKKGQKVYVRICAYQKKSGKRIEGKCVTKNVA